MTRGSVVLVAIVLINVVLLAGYWLTERSGSPDDAPGATVGEAGDDAAPIQSESLACVASDWSTNAGQTHRLVRNLRSQGHIATVEEGVVEYQIGFRIVARERIRLEAAARWVRRARDAGYPAFAATGADGRPTVAFGRFDAWKPAEQYRLELQRAGFDAVTEPLYRTRAQTRAVAMPPPGRNALFSPESGWHAADCQALVW